MKLKVQKPDRDLEVELYDNMAYLEELTADTLPRDFWTVEEWNWIVQERARVRGKLKWIKKELSKC